MRVQKEMDKIKVESYKDCVWYIEEEDRCQLPSICKSTSECFCKDKELEEVCIWITKFLKSTSKEEKNIPKYSLIDDRFDLSAALKELDKNIDKSSPYGMFKSFIEILKKKVYR